MDFMRRIGLGFTDLDRRAIPKDEVAFAQMLINNRLMWMNLIAMNPLPAGRFDTTMVGTTIPTTPAWVGTVRSIYTELIQNKESGLIGVCVYAQFAGVPGKQVKLSLTGNASDEQVVDYLGDTPSAPSFNKRISTTIILKPKQKIFIAYAADPAVFPCTVDTRFMIRVFNPAEYLHDTFWEAR